MKKSESNDQGLHITEGVSGTWFRQSHMMFCSLQSPRDWLQFIWDGDIEGAILVDGYISAKFHFFACLVRMMELDGGKLCHSVFIFPDPHNAGTLTAIRFVHQPAHHQHRRTTMTLLCWPWRLLRQLIFSIYFLVGTSVQAQRSSMRFSGPG